jgi:beta-lactamase class D
MTTIRLLRSGLNLVLMATVLTACATQSSAPALAPTATPTSDVRPELAKYFQGFSGAFVLYDLNHSDYQRYNPEHCAERYLPASTFKIVNSLIGLETGVIPHENYVIKWDGTHYDIPAWNQDQTLKSAVQNSVVWYFRELARRVGKEKIQHYVDAIGYGNQDISGPPDGFWLYGTLRISADEQVELLKRLYRNDLPFSLRSMKIDKEILVLDKTDTYQLSGKTGAGQVGDDHIGWFVGYVEEKSNVYFFAANISGPSTDVTGTRAKEIAQSILRGLEILP